MKDVYHLHANTVTVLFDGHCSHCNLIQPWAKQTYETNEWVVRMSVTDIIEVGSAICAGCGADLNMNETVEVEEYTPC